MQESNRVKADVPYIAYESAMARADSKQHRLIIALIVSNLSWLAIAVILFRYFTK